MTNSGNYVDRSTAQTIAGIKTFSALIGGSINGNAATATNVVWGGVTGRPTTIAGYGITDAVNLSQTGNWNTAYTRLTTSGNKWDTAYNWGNHAGLYIPIGYLPGSACGAMEKITWSG